MWITFTWNSIFLLNPFLHSHVDDLADSVSLNPLSLPSRLLLVSEAPGDLPLSALGTSPGHLPTVLLPSLHPTELQHTNSYSKGKQCTQNKLFLKTINSVLEDFDWSAKSYEYGSDKNLCLKCNLLKQDVADIRNFTIIMSKSCNTQKKYTLNKQAKPWILIINSIIKYCTWYSVFSFVYMGAKRKKTMSVQTLE